MNLPALERAAPSQRRLFRQAALDQLASPERLDTLMKVTDTQGWLALLGCAAVLASALCWGVFGSVPSKQPTNGILIFRSGLADVVGVGAGQITAIEVNPGELVHKGQVVARLAQPALQEELAGLQARRRELQLGFEQSRRLESQDVQQRAAAAVRARVALRSAMAASQQRQRELSERRAAQQRLYDQGLLTRETLLATEDALRSARTALQGLKTDLEQLDVTRLGAMRLNEAERQEHTARIQDNERRIGLLEQRLEQHSRVISPYDGRIVELRATVGDVLEAGQAVLSVERTAQDDGLEALLYVDSRQSKRIKPGMRVEISPSMARRERYGVLRGVVRAIEAFPSTRRGMLRALHNEQLVENLLMETQGVPTALRASLLTDRSTASGYLWSSRRGATLKLSSGTRCSGAVLTGAQRPLSLLFPTLEVVF
jgi:HlyD family secretion protein